MCVQPCSCHVPHVTGIKSIASAHPQVYLVVLRLAVPPTPMLVQSCSWSSMVSQSYCISWLSPSQVSAAAVWGIVIEYGCSTHLKPFVRQSPQFQHTQRGAGRALGMTDARLYSSHHLVTLHAFNSQLLG